MLKSDFLLNFICVPFFLFLLNAIFLFGLPLISSKIKSNVKETFFWEILGCVWFFGLGFVVSFGCCSLSRCSFHVI